MTNNERLREILTVEAELLEGLLETMRRQQDAIVHLQSNALGDIAVQMNELARPIEKLEEQRQMLMPKTIELGKTQEPESNHRMAELVARLKAAAHAVKKINDENRLLLDQSLRFVRENVRILTNNYNRQLVDHKV